MENDHMATPPKRSPVKVLSAVGFMLFAWYTDILALQIPLFAQFLCPVGIVVLIAWMAFRRLGWKTIFIRSLLGLPLLLLITSAMSVFLSQAHDRWLMEQVRAWGNELRAENTKMGTYPPTQVRSLHGYRAQYVKPANAYDHPTIYFHKFGQMRQSYLIQENRFLEETES